MRSVIACYKAASLLGLTSVWRRILVKHSTWFFLALSAVAGFSTPAFADENEQVREAYVRVETDVTTAKKDSLLAGDRQALFNYVRDHKVAALTAENLKKYDPTGEVGYCYGRAMAVHLRARRMGLRPEAIRKLFIIGDLRSGTAREWRFHVTTLVKGDDLRWYAIDPLLVDGVGKNRPEPLEEWVRLIRNVWDKKKAAHLYMVESNSIVPDIRVFPWEKTDEKGDKITDLIFDPSTADGFKEKQIGGEKVYVVNREQQAKHFLQAKEKVDADQFDFSRLKMTVLDGDKRDELDYDYHHYFQELVDDIAKAPVVNRRERPLSGAAPEGTEIHVRPRGTEIHGTEIHGTEIHYGSLRPKLPRTER